ncbi:MAG: metallophosphoesterase [Clostridia bacterium]|nr:metallophosphoesterase [Clostridia bacterium]
MSLFAIGDTHLSFSCNKPMDVFKGWDNYVERLEKQWRAVVSEKDTVVVAGDISWAMKIEDAIKDFSFLESLPGEKIILKGNHDYWWQTKKKLDEFLEKNNFKTIKILFNNAYKVDDFVICGSRGWFYDAETDADMKVLNREAGRLQLSFDFADEYEGEKIAFLHYPPLMQSQSCKEIIDVLKRNKIKRCYYGHLHAQSVNLAFNGEYEGIKFSLISSDFLGFCPKLIEKF